MGVSLRRTPHRECEAEKKFVWYIAEPSRRPPNPLGLFVNITTVKSWYNMRTLPESIESSHQYTLYHIKKKYVNISIISTMSYSPSLRNDHPLAFFTFLLCAHRWRILALIRLGYWIPFLSLLSSMAWLAGSFAIWKVTLRNVLLVALLSILLIMWVYTPLLFKTTVCFISESRRKGRTKGAVSHSTQCPFGRTRIIDMSSNSLFFADAIYDELRYNTHACIGRAPDNGA